MTSRAGYWIGGGLIVAAVAGAVLWAVLSFVAIGNTLDGFIRVDAPGTERVQLEARKYIVYFEGPGVDQDFVAPIEFQIVNADGNRELPVGDYSASVTYSMSGHSGRAQATVTPPSAGTYVVRVATSDDGSAGYSVALGDSIGGRIVRAILGAFAIGGVLFAAGLALLITTAVRRNKRRKPPPPPPAPPPAPAGVAGLEG